MRLLTASVGMLAIVSHPLVAQTSDAPIKRVVPPAGVAQEGPPPLLREGGILVDVPGTIARDRRLGVHVFRPSLERTGGVRRELVLLPSRGLEDLARIEERRGGVDEPSALDATFEVTGRVLVYRGRNFLLPESVVLLETPTSTSSAATPTSPSTGTDPEDADDIAGDIEARLESRVGAVPRSLDLAEASAVERSPIRPGTRYVDRRGQLARDPESGVWRFIPAGGRSDGGVVLLPCLELERLERTARSRDVSQALLVSGVITAFRGRNYLLPTAVGVATEGRGIGP